MKINAAALLNSIKQDFGGGPQPMQGERPAPFAPMAKRALLPEVPARGAPAPQPPQPMSGAQVQGPAISPQQPAHLQVQSNGPQGGIQGNPGALNLQGGSIPVGGGNAIKLSPLAYHPQVGLHFKVLR